MAPPMGCFFPRAPQYLASPPAFPTLPGPDAGLVKQFTKVMFTPQGVILWCPGRYSQQNPLSHLPWGNRGSSRGPHFSTPATCQLGENPFSPCPGSVAAVSLLPPGADSYSVPTGQHASPVLGGQVTWRQQVARAGDGCSQASSAAAGARRLAFLGLPAAVHEGAQHPHPSGCRGHETPAGWKGLSPSHSRENTKPVPACTSLAIGALAWFHCAFLGSATADHGCHCAKDSSLCCIDRDWGLDFRRVDSY